MRVGYSLAIILAVLAACQRTESRGSRPSPSPAATVIVAPRADSAPPAAAGPSAAVSPGAEEADDDDILKPWSDEFEIDADPDWYFGYLPMEVNFTAKPLNGIPPFTYVWDFGDGSPTTTGERAVHVYQNEGSYHSAVVGTDGRGQQYRVEIILKAVTREEYAQRKHVDPALLPTPVSTP